MLIVLLRQKHKAPLSIKSPEPRAKGNVNIRGGNYSKGLNKQDINLTDRLLARPSNQSARVIGRHEDALGTIPSKDEGEDSQLEKGLNLYIGVHMGCHPPEGKGGL